MKQNWNRSGREESGRVPGSDRIRGYLSVLYSFRRPLYLFIFYFFLSLIYVLFFKRIFKRTHLRESTQKNIRKKLDLETNFLIYFYFIITMFIRGGDLPRSTHQAVEGTLKGIKSLLQHFLSFVPSLFISNNFPIQK